MKGKFNVKKMTLILIVSGLTFSVLRGQADKLLGKWVYQYEGASVTLQINNGDQLIFDGESARYEVTGNAIRVFDEYGYYFDYLYTLRQDQLGITFPDGYVYVFTRQAEKPGMQVRQSAPGSASVSGLYGSLCSYSGSSGSYSSYSSSKVLSFDGQGNFKLRNSSSYSGGGDLYYNSGDDNSQVGTYRILKGYVELKYSNGSVENLTINIVQNSGEITELMAGSVLYAKSLCE